MGEADIAYLTWWIQDFVADSSLTLSATIKKFYYDKMRDPRLWRIHDNYGDDAVALTIAEIMNNLDLLEIDGNE